MSEQAQQAFKSGLMQKVTKKPPETKVTAPPIDEDDDGGVWQKPKDPVKIKPLEVKKAPGKPGKITYDPEGYVLVGGGRVVVNGCQVFRQKDGEGYLYLRAGDYSDSYQVRKGRGSDRVYEWDDLTFQSKVAKIGGDPLSLERRWTFRWGVVIADVGKYENDAFVNYRDEQTDLEIGTIRAGQFYAGLGLIGGTNAHLSIDARDVRAEIRKLMARGGTPGQGFLSDCRFHVTIEVHGRDNSKNPHVFSGQSPEWQSSGFKISEGDALAVGRAWLQSHR